MDERNIRTERTTGTNTDYDRDVDIRRTMIMGRDIDAQGHHHVVASAPMKRALHWGPIMAGWATATVSSLLLGSLFLGLGFDRSYGAFGGLTSGEVGIGTAVAMLLGIFIGAYLTGYVSDLRSKAEGILNGFMVGVLSILVPLAAAAFAGLGMGAAASTNLPDSSNPVGAAGSVASNTAAAVPNAVENTVRTAATVAADNAWQVFLIGALILGVGTLAGFLGRKSREKALEAQAKHDLDAATY